MTTHIEAITEDLNINVGTGVTKSVGSDAYPYYVTEVLPNGVFGLYRASSGFDETHPWEGGTEVVQPFDLNHTSEFYVKRRYGGWWRTTKEGKSLAKWSGKYVRISFNGAHGYRDPSF